MENYEKVKKLGKGSFGDVMLVKCKKDNKLYAMKKISVFALDNPSFSPLNEIQLMESLDHPNIIKYYDSFEHKGDLCIIMEYADSGDLSVKLMEAQKKNQHFDEEQILDWLVQLCLSLNCLHDNKILHRDIKISNIFLTQTDLIKLGDFGISKKLESTNDFAKTSVGTPFYLPPEMVDKQNYEHYDFAVDVWMLGCVIYELCTFQKAFYTPGESLENFFHKICFEKTNPIPNIYSPFLQKLINQMMNKIPNNRIKVSEILEMTEIKEKFEKLKISNKVFQEYFNNTNNPFITRNSLTAIIKKRKASFMSFDKQSSNLSSDQSILDFSKDEMKMSLNYQIKIKNAQKLENHKKSLSFLQPPQNCKKTYQKEISINTTGLDNQYQKKQDKENHMDSSKNNDISSIPTEKVQTKKFSFITSFESKSPNSSNRSIISSEFLKNKLGKEKFTKMKELIEGSCNPLKSLDDRKIIIDIIGENNIECIEIYKFLISNAVTPSNSNNNESFLKKNQDFILFPERKDSCSTETKK